MHTRYTSKQLIPTEKFATSPNPIQYSSSSQDSRTPSKGISCTVVPSFFFRHSYLPPMMMNPGFFLSSSLFYCSSVSEKILGHNLPQVYALWLQKLDPLFIKTAPWNRIDECSGAICSICDPQASELDAWPSSPWPPAQWCSSVLVRKSINLDLGPWGVVLHSLTRLQLSFFSEALLVRVHAPPISITPSHLSSNYITLIFIQNLYF